MRSWTSWTVGSLLLMVPALAPSTSSAQEVAEPFFFTLEAGVSGPINDPLNDQFNLGGDGSVGAFMSFIPELAGGLRLRAGGLSEGEVVPQDPVNRGVLDYGTLTLSLRLRPLARVMDEDRRATGLYFETEAGGALLDGDAVPAFAAAVGYNFGLGPVAIGPRFRFTHMVEVNDRFGDNDVFTWTGGIEVAFMDTARTIPAPRAEVDLEPITPEVEVEEEVAAGRDRDGDWILDDNDACPDEAEVFNGYEDADGCPDEGTGRFVNDALVVDERVFFDYDESELRPTGIDQLDAVVEHYRQHGQHYERLIIGGHADARGTIPYNEDLSRRRAQAVADYLVSQGVPRDIIDVRAYGEVLPAIPDADTEYDFQVNRRVAFEVEWAEGQEPTGMAPEANPTMPEVVDEAPESVQERERRADIREREAREREMAQAELEELDETERVAIEREREGSARVAARVATAETEVEVQEPQARAEVEVEESVID